MKRPEVWNILLSGVDGSLAAHARESTARRRLSGLVPEADFMRMKALVAQCDAVLLGARTLAAERGAFRVADLRPEGEPVWMVFSATGNMDPNHPFWRQKGIPRAVCFCTDFELESETSVHQENRALFGVGTDFYIGSLGAMLNLWGEQGLKRVALLGGGELNAHFWRAGAVDRLFLTVSPWLLGGEVRLLAGTLPTPVPLTLERCEREGNLLFLEYAAKHYEPLKLVRE